jgi:hypothetical protein
MVNLVVAGLWIECNLLQYHEPSPNMSSPTPRELPRDFNEAFKRYSPK